MAYFLSVHTLSLIVGMSHFPILGKNFAQSHSVTRKCPQNTITLILRYFNNFSLDFIYLEPFHPPHTHTHTPLQQHPHIKDKRVITLFIT